MLSSNRSRLAADLVELSCALVFCSSCCAIAGGLWLLQSLPGGVFLVLLAPARSTCCRAFFSAFLAFASSFSLAIHVLSSALRSRSSAFLFLGFSLFPSLLFLFFKLLLHLLLLDEL